MRIDELKVNGFGKLSEKEIELKDGINIIYGENESGKSTLLKFISSMLYGASKNKNGKSISDFEKYKPWYNTEYSGKIKYTLDNGEKFEIFREFSKKNPQVLNERLEDITKQFNIDKNKSVDFFYEQTKISEEDFLNTTVSEQAEVVLNKNEQSQIIQKISNKISTGNDNISYQKTMEKLNKKLNIEIGTERTVGRPINIANEKIEQLEKEKIKIAEAKDDENYIIEEKSELVSNLKNEEIKEKILKKAKNIIEKNRIKIAEINLSKNAVNDIEEKIQELEQNDDLKKESKGKTFFKTKEKIILFIMFVVNILLFMLCHIDIINYVFLILTALTAIYFAQKNLKVSFKEENINNLKTEKLKKEIELLERNKISTLREVKEKENKLQEEIAKEEENLLKEYENYNEEEIKEILKLNYENLISELEENQNNINSIKLRMHTVEIDEKNIKEKEEGLAKIEEEIVAVKQEKETLNKYKEEILIAKECIEKAYIQMKDKIRPAFEENVSDTISKITNEKYKKVVFDDVSGLRVELNNGSYIDAENLSIGTIDELYLSLRINTIKELTEEKMPIILDETFAYFDNYRLNNILKYLNEKFENNQIILFTCSNREKEILSKLNIRYNLVEM